MIYCLKSERRGTETALVKTTWENVIVDARFNAASERCYCTRYTKKIILYDMNNFNPLHIIWGTIHFSTGK